MMHFRFNPERFAQALNLLLAKTGPKTHGEICKLIYLADREHLLKHGRPIVGGPYNALPRGPVPSFVLDTLEDLAWSTFEAQAARKQVPEEYVSFLDRYVEVRVEVPFAVYAAKPSNDMSLLSESDREIVNLISDTYGKMSFEELVELTHKHAAWRRTPRPSEIDYALFFVDSPAGKDVSEYLAMMRDEDAPVAA